MNGIISFINIMPVKFNNDKKNLKHLETVILITYCISCYVFVKYSICKFFTKSYIRFSKVKKNDVYLPISCY